MCGRPRAVIIISCDAHAQDDSLAAHNLTLVAAHLWHGGRRGRRPPLQPSRLPDGQVPRSDSLQPRDH